MMLFVCDPVHHLLHFFAQSKISSRLFYLRISMLTSFSRTIPILSMKMLSGTCTFSIPFLFSFLLSCFIFVLEPSNVLFWFYMFPIWFNSFVIGVVLFVFGLRFQVILAVLKFLCCIFGFGFRFLVILAVLEFLVLCFSSLESDFGLF